MPGKYNPDTHDYDASYEKPRYASRNTYNQLIASGLAEVPASLYTSSDWTAVKDSGERRAFDTGSVRDSREGKGRFDLISPFAMKRLAKHYENGAKKYGDRNWEKGQQIMSYFDSAARHMNAWLSGEDDEDHLAAAMWNIAAIIHTQEMIARSKLPESLNDRPLY